MIKSLHHYFSNVSSLNSHTPQRSSEFSLALFCIPNGMMSNRVGQIEVATNTCSSNWCVARLPPHARRPSDPRFVSWSVLLAILLISAFCLADCHPPTQCSAPPPTMGTACFTHSPLCLSCVKPQERIWRIVQVVPPCEASQWQLTLELLWVIYFSNNCYKENKGFCKALSSSGWM